MSNSLINRNEDLSALVSVGYCVKIRGMYLVVENIPYVTENGKIKTAALVTSLDVSGVESKENTVPPQNHTVWWTGGTPYTANGESMESYLVCKKWETGRDIGEQIVVYQQWSRKPLEGGKMRKYWNYREKMETYIQEVGDHADAKLPGCLEAAKRGWTPDVKSNTRFHYMDTNSYRSGTKGIEKRIEEEFVAVIGVGGSGSYLVDILAKTNIKELHLYDDDFMEVHNAFRVAGAARVAELSGSKFKVDWHNDRYTVVRKEGLYVHKMKITKESIEALSACTTVFIAVDDLKVRRMIQRALSKMGILHLSVGIGIEIEGEQFDQIGGNVKVEVDYQNKYHSHNDNTEPLAVDDERDVDEREDIYGSNIQTAELNMLGAALAITEWKARRGIYRNERDEGIDSTIYSSTTGKIQVARKGG